jgi:serine/threonine-protein kinase
MREVGPYVLLKELASGGMGTVFLGHPRSSGVGPARVAIKKPHDSLLLDGKARERFLREARIASVVRHPNVVGTIDVITAGESVYYVMEYVDGEPLSGLQQLVADRGTRASAGIALRIVVDVLLGLEAVHSARAPDGRSLEIVHRDVSPQNVLVGVDGIAKITDFGVARTATNRTTAEGGLKGKVRYVAPEQIRGETATRAADIYSAAVIAWELLAGQPLFFGGSEAAVLARVLAGRVRPLARFAPDLPEAVEEKIRWGLAQAPADRPPSALALAEALEATGIVASHADVAAFVTRIAGDRVRERGALASVPPPRDETAVLGRAVSADPTVRLGPADGPDGTVVLGPRTGRPPPPAVISVRAPAPPRRGRLGVVAIVVSVACVALVSAVAAVWIGWRSAAPRPAPPLESAAAAASSVAPPSAATEPPREAVASAAPADNARPTAPPPPRVREGRHAAPPRAAKERTDCSVPYVVDETGIRRIRKECL